jgi:signal transduction histidine kinase
VALRGFVYGPFRAGDLLSNIFPPDAEREIDVQVFDLVRGRPDALLFDSRGPDAVRDARFEISFRVEVADRPWWIVVSSRPALEDSPHRSFLAWTIIGGLALSLTLFALMRLEVRARDVAEQATGSLQQSQAALRASARELERVVAAERDAHAEAAEANRVKDEFLATLSHELRTPLNAILGWASMLREKRLDPVQQARALEVIERNARSQAELVDDLLEVSRIITGKLRLELRGIDLEPAVAAAVDAVKPMAEARGVALHWQPQTRGRVLGDPDRMQQVAWNLLSNAIKFTPRGGSVTADVIERDGFVELVVSDAGVGIAPEFLPHVFERFRQADSSTKRGHGGLGLGLAIVRHLVEAHGGGVHAHSDGENRGATFTVRLPAYHGARDRSAATEAAPLAATGSSPGLSAARVLVVDDEPDARDLVGAIVRESGGRAVAVSSVGEALGALHANRFDLIIADIGMPGRDGLDFIREVRSLPPEAGGTIPALALTAYGRPEDRRRAIDAGYQAHLVKPARPEDIVAAAESLLKGR